MSAKLSAPNGGNIGVPFQKIGSRQGRNDPAFFYGLQLHSLYFALIAARASHKRQPVVKIICGTSDNDYRLEENFIS
jgi:hypothetical protein